MEPQRLHYRYITIDGGNSGITLSVWSLVTVSTRIDGFAITNGTYGIYAEGSVTISNNDIYGNGVGIFLNGHSPLPLAENNSIHDNNGPGVTIDNGSAKLSKNKIWANQGAGVSVGVSGYPTIEGNTIRDNSGSLTSILLATKQIGFKRSHFY